MPPITESPEWRALDAHFDEVRDLHLRDLFARDPGRGERLAVREHDAGSQLQRVTPPIVGARPALGERRLDLLRDLIYTNELGLREVRNQVGRGLAPRETVEGPRFIADGYDQVAAARDSLGAGRRCRGVWRG